MPFTKDRAGLALAALLTAAFLWNAFSASAMEQFVHMRGFFALGAALRWLSFAGVLLLLPALMWEERRCEALCRFVLLPVLLSGICSTGSYFALLSPDLTEIAAYTLFNGASVLACLHLIARARGRLFAPRVNPKSCLRLFLLVVIATAPLNIFMQVPLLMSTPFLLFRRFGGWHIASLVLLVATTLFCNESLRKKSKAERYFSLFMLSMCLFVHLSLRFSFVRLHDYQAAHGVVGALPLYVCSFGIALLPFAILSKNAFFQGALFLVNCPGAIIAFVWPSPGAVTVAHYNVTYFVLSHILLFAVTAQLPLLEGTPRRAHFLHLTWIIVLYYLAMVALNTLAVRTGNGYDPNFSYVAHCPLPLPLQNILTVQLGPFRFSPVYIAILCAVQYALCIVTWLVYRLVLRIRKALERRKMRFMT